MNEDKKKLTVPDLIQRKKDQQRVVMVAAPDFLMAQWAERAGIDFIGIGDSLGMTLYGHPTTLPMTVDMMIEPVSYTHLTLPTKCSV